ncbi:hypothetical protein QCBJ_27345 [Pseudomonas sp. QC2]|nr:hypothetical protein QCBJ_27345 [Pseudomonas sp. QC2]
MGMNIDTTLLWRASLLALGCEAAPRRATRFPRESGGGFIRAASRPNASKLARHNEPVGSESCVQGGSCL